MNIEEYRAMCKTANKALHRTAIPLRSIAAGELVVRVCEKDGRDSTTAIATMASLLGVLPGYRTGCC